MENAKRLYKNSNMLKKIMVALVAIIGVTIYVYEMVIKAVSVKSGFASIGVIVLILVVIEGMFVLSEVLLFKDATELSGTIDSFRGIGNGKLLLVKTDSGLLECAYYKRSMRGVYVGQTVTVIKRGGLFYQNSYPVVFPC